MNEKVLLALLDRGSWKHSAYLPTYEGSYCVNWYANETLGKVLKEIQKARQEAADLMAKANDAYLEIEPLVIERTTCCVTSETFDDLLTVWCEDCGGYVSEGHYRKEVEDGYEFNVCDNCGGNNQ